MDQEKKQLHETLCELRKGANKLAERLSLLSDSEYAESLAESLAARANQAIGLLIDLRLKQPPIRSDDGN